MPIGQNHSKDALDGTLIMMNVIKAQFLVSASLVAFLHLVMIILLLSVMEQDGTGISMSIEFLYKYGYLAFAAVIFFIVFFIGSIFCDIWMNVVRY